MSGSVADQVEPAGRSVLSGLSPQLLLSHAAFDRPGRLPSGWMRMSSPSSRTRIRLGGAVRFSYPADDAARVHGVPRLARPGRARRRGLWRDRAGHTRDRSFDWYRAAAHRCAGRRASPSGSSLGSSSRPRGSSAGSRRRSCSPRWSSSGSDRWGSSSATRPAAISPDGSSWALARVGCGSGSRSEPLERWPGCEYLCMSAVWPL
jgi:hypothetical protein